MSFKIVELIEIIDRRYLVLFAGTLRTNRRAPASVHDCSGSGASFDRVSDKPFNERSASDRVSWPKTSTMTAKAEPHFQYD